MNTRRQNCEGHVSFHVCLLKKYKVAKKFGRPPASSLQGCVILSYRTFIPFALITTGSPVIGRANIPPFPRMSKGFSNTRRHAAIVFAYIPLLRRYHASMENLLAEVYNPIYIFRRITLVRLRTWRTRRWRFAGGGASRWQILLIFAMGS